MDNAIESTVVVNRERCPIVRGRNLTQAEKCGVAHIDADSMNDACFFRYRGKVYAISDMRMIAPAVLGYPDLTVEAYWGTFVTVIER